MTMKQLLLTIFLLSMVALGSFFGSVLFHEMLHAVYDMPGNISKSICVNLNPEDKGHTNQTMIAYVTQAKTDITYTERHYSIYMSQGIALAALLIFGYMTVCEVMFPRQIQKPMCFGTKEFSPLTNICRHCDFYEKCNREYDKNHRIRRF